MIEMYDVWDQYQKAYIFSKSQFDFFDQRYQKKFGTFANGAMATIFGVTRRRRLFLLNVVIITLSSSSIDCFSFISTSFFSSPSLPTRLVRHRSTTANIPGTRKCHRFILSPSSSSSSSSSSSQEIMISEEIRHVRKETSLTKHHVSNNINPNDNDDDAVLLTFLGSKCITSPSAPIKSMISLYDYFTIKTYRNLLFFQNNVSSPYIPMTQSLFDTWNEQAKLGGGTGPSCNKIQWIENKKDPATTVNNNYYNFSLNTSNQQLYPEQCQVIQMDAHLQLPGLRVLSKSTIGVKLHLVQQEVEEEKYLLPEYQFTLLDSQLIPTGPPPLVWLFNQLTKYRSTTSSFTRVQAIVSKSLSSSSSSSSSSSGSHTLDDLLSVHFTTQARLETKIRIPTFVANTLSLSTIHKFEVQGSEAVQKLLESELEPALLQFYYVYCKNYINP